MNDYVQIVRDDQRGFTFIEMLLVLFIFIIVLIACSDIFLRSQRAQYQAQGMQRLQDDARYVVNTIADDIRTGGIDYACYSGGYCSGLIDATGSTKVLALTNAQNNKKIVKIGTDGCVDVQSSPCVSVSDDNGVTWQSMTQKGVTIEAAKSSFVISPTSDPFVLDASNAYLSNVQPHVTIRLEEIATIRGLKTPTHLGLQTTVVTREYKR